MWKWSEQPWSRLHHEQPFQGKIFLDIVDVHSKWLDIYPVKKATSQATTGKTF